MDLSPEFLKKLITTFQSELEEGLQVITEGLLWLEKHGMNDSESESVTEKILRSAHNIKGAARGVGITDVGDIAHHIESLFSALRKNPDKSPGSIFDLCFEAIDDMRLAMQAFSGHTPLPFNLANLLKRMEGNDTDAVTMASPAPSVTAPKETEIPVPLGTATPSPQTAAATVPEQKTTAVSSHSSEQETIRVSLKSLDRVSALMEEIQVSKIAIDDHYTDLSHFSDRARQLSELWRKTFTSSHNSHSIAGDDQYSRLYTTSLDALTEIEHTTRVLQQTMRTRINDLSILSGALQEEVRLLRLVPASMLLSSFPRTVRDLARDLNKKIDFEISGDSVKLDKLVLEGLKDPLIHLLRNAIDHGIEEPAVRKSKGKPETGTLRVQISEEGDRILFQISDDGSGIDSDKIREVALEKKIITKSDLDAMTPDEVLELIFRPGFSTMEKVTAVSGRGVGLDVVKENISRLNGHVSVETVPSKGALFTMRVPLTLSSEQGLMISAGGQSFAIPVHSVEKVMMITGGDIIDVEASQAIMVDGHAIPFRIMSYILGIKTKEETSPDRLPVVVVKKGWNTVAMLVDEIIGEREIVIKQLQAPLLNVRCVSGGTLAGNGRVIVVLNAGEMIEAALHSRTVSHISHGQQERPLSDIPHILVVDDSITTRTLEKNVLESKGYRVTVAVNGKEAWNLLNNEKFSLLVTDVSMPVMDGFTLTEKIRQSREISDLPVIIVTSLGSDAEKKRGIDAGASAYIVKSEFESGALLEIVSQLV